MENFTFLDRPFTDLSAEDLEAKEEKEMREGPMCILHYAVKNQTKVLIKCIFGRSYEARVKVGGRNSP